MQKNKTRLTVITGTTLALVMAGTAAVSAHPGTDRDEQRGFGPSARIQRAMGEHMPGLFEKGMARMGDRGDFRDGMRDGIRGAIEDFERRETTVQTADGTTTYRVENGVVDSADDTGVGFSLGSGEAVTVAIDDDTHIVAFSEETVERGRRSRQRMLPAEVELADIEAGAEIVVWSDSEDGGDFVAQRIVIRPTDVEAETETETVEETTTEEAASTDA